MSIQQGKGKGKRGKSNNLRRVKRAKIGDKLTNTQRRNEVVLKDLQFWLPLIREEDLEEVARGKVKLVKTVSEFWELKPIHQAHILVGFIKKYRKGRNPKGKRYPNMTL